MLQSILKKKEFILAPFVVAFVALTYFVRHNGFFWDSIVLGSGYAHWYYNSNFEKLFVSEELAGYPPIFGMYLALGWKIFGKTLPVSHALMLPFLIGIVVQTYNLVKKFIPDLSPYWALLLILVEPTLLAQAAQIGPDIPLVFLYLVCLNAIITGKRGLLAIVLIFLAMLSPRGTIMVLALFMTDVANSFIAEDARLTIKSTLSKVIAYLPALFITCLWLLMHFKHYGWVFYNADSEWGSGAGLVTLNGFFKNIIVIAWRFADFGKVVIYFALLYLLAWGVKRKQLKKDTLQLILFAAIPLIVLSSIIVFFQNPIAHRYYIVVFILSLLLLGHLLQYIKPAKRVIIYGVSLVSLILGHYVVLLYPASIAKGWDGTLAHLPYYELRANMIDYLEDQNISFREVGSAYPNLRPMELIDLNSKSETFSDKDLSKQNLIMHSNIFNDFTDEELLELEKHWQVVKEFKDAGIFVRLYKKQR